MALRVLVVEAKPQIAQILASFFEEREDEVWHAWKLEEASALLDLIHPNLVLMDLHFPEERWVDFLRSVRQQHPDTKILITTKRIDLQREIQVKQLGIQVFVRQPFTKYWLEQSLYQLRVTPKQPSSPHHPPLSISTARFPLQAKMILPYFLVGLLFALAGAYIARQITISSLDDQFNQRLIQANHTAASWMARREDKMLTSLRLIANAEGLTTAIKKNDTTTLQALVTPLVLNASEHAVHVLDPEGISLLSMHRSARDSLPVYDTSTGETAFQRLNFVQKALIGLSDQKGDKFIGLAKTAWGDYIYLAAPVYDGGQVAGSVLIGQSLQSLAQEFNKETGSEMTIYDVSGVPLASTLSLSEDHPTGSQLAMQIISRQNTGGIKRYLTIDQTRYQELLSIWEARGGSDLGILGVALEPKYTLHSSYLLRLETALFLILPVLLLLFVGRMIAATINQPISSLIKAAEEMAQGNAAIKVNSQGNDEISALTRAFNTMVVSLQENTLFRDLMGYAPGREMSQKLRQTFNVRDLHLEGQKTTATVLATDIRNLTQIASAINPDKFFELLNQYFNLLSPIAANYHGVINKLDGDAMLVYFGVLPEMITPSEGAWQACKAATAMLQAIETFNGMCQKLGYPPMITEIGIDTGAVTIGGLSIKDHLHYTVIGNAVKNAQYLESLSRTLFDHSVVLVSGNTITALMEHQFDFQFETIGSYQLRGKAETTTVYKMLPRQVAF